MAYKELIEQVRKASYVGSIGAVLGWDQEVVMPKGSVDLRSHQLSVLSGIQHGMFANKKVGMLIRKAKKESLAKDQQVNLKWIEYDYRRQIRVPNDLVSEFAKVSSHATEAWRQARKTNKFKLFEPHLQKIVALEKKRAMFINAKKQLYDVLLQGYDNALTSAQVASTFAVLKRRIPPLLRERKKPKQISFSEEKQRKLNVMIAEKMGFNFRMGRLDVSTHPFTSGTMIDTRITTRYSQHPFESILALVHETGHGLYEQGLPWKHFGTPLGESVSMSMHESQSRIWENNVGRSEGFARWLAPKMGIGWKQIYDTVNYVHPSFIRVEADEVSYHMHIILRFEIERDLMNGKLSVKEIPQVWNEKMKEYLGITPKTDALGCLQDIHWTFGFGYFPTYSFGTMIAAQLFDAAKKRMPGLSQNISKGNFMMLRNWLLKNIHEQGRRYDTNELTKRVTGEKPNPRALLALFEAKHSKN